MSVPAKREPSPAEAAHDRLLALRSQAVTILAELCTVAYLVDSRGYWQDVRRPNGSRYVTPEEYFVEVLDVGNWRTAQRMIRSGRVLSLLHPDDLQALVPVIQDAGLSKLDVVAPAVLEIADAGENPDTTSTVLRGWLERARKSSVIDLQAEVNMALERQPKALPEGDRPLSIARGWMPDLDALATFDAFVGAARRLRPGGRFVSYLIDAMQEFLASNPDPKTNEET